MLWMQEFLSDTVSIQQQPGLQMDERDEAAAPAEQVSLFLFAQVWLLYSGNALTVNKQPSPVVLRRKPKDEAPQSLEPPLRDSTAHLRCPQFQLILCIINLIIDWAYESYIPKVEVPGVLNSTNFQPNFSTAIFSRSSIAKIFQ